MAKPRTVIVTLNGEPPAEATVNLFVRQKLKPSGVLMPVKKEKMDPVTGQPRVYIAYKVDVDNSDLKMHKVLLRVEVTKKGETKPYIIFHGRSPDRVK